MLMAVDNERTDDSGRDGGGYWGEERRGGNFGTKCRTRKRHGGVVKVNGGRNFYV